MAITKRDFAVKLLFWLLPWPISRALPRSLRIYYFGPGAGPPPGFYDYWGTPGFYWPDPEIPIDPDLFPDLPDDIFNPGDPVDPTPPDDWPDLPDGPSPDPWPPSPSPPPGPTPQPIPPAGWFTMFDNTYWQTDDQAEWNVDHWDFLGTFAVSIKPTGEWSRGFRPTKWRVTHDNGPGLRLTLVNAGEPGWASAVPITSGVAYDCDFEGASDADITGAEIDSGVGGCNFDITNIEFFS